MVREMSLIGGHRVDITERKRAEEALRRSEAYLAEAQRLTHTGALVADDTIEPLYWSEEMFRLSDLIRNMGTDARPGATANTPGRP